MFNNIRTKPDFGDSYGVCHFDEDCFYYWEFCLETGEVYSDTIIDGVVV